MPTSASAAPTSNTKPLAAAFEDSKNWRYVHFGRQTLTYPIEHPTDCTFVLRDVGFYITVRAHNHRLHSGDQSYPELPREGDLLRALADALSKEERLTKVKLEETRVYTRGMELEELEERVKAEVDGIWELCRPREEETGEA